MICWYEVELIQVTIFISLMENHLERKWSMRPDGSYGNLAYVGVR